MVGHSRWPTDVPPSQFRADLGAGRDPARPGEIPSASGPWEGHTGLVREGGADQKVHNASVPATLALLAAAAMVATTIALTRVAGWSWSDSLNAFVVSNSLIGASFAICGGFIVWFRPRNPVGWLLTLDGFGHLLSAVAAPAASVLQDQGAPSGVVRTAVSVFTWSWPWSIGLFLPVMLLVFPDGRLPSRRWLPVLIAVVVTAPLFALDAGADPVPPQPGVPSAWGSIPDYQSLASVWIVAELRTLAALGAGVAALVVRYRHGDSRTRQQLLWLILATSIVVLGVIPWSLVAGTPILVLFAIPLIPAAVAVAILRGQLYDIRPFVSRALTWLLLSSVVVLGSALVVAAFDATLVDRTGSAAVLSAGVAVAAAFALPSLRRAVERLVYGARRDPAAVVGAVGKQLDGLGDLDAVADAIRNGLKLPYVAVLAGPETLAVSGVPASTPHRLPLRYGGAGVGELVVEPRPGERHLTSLDEEALSLVAAPLSAAVHALVVSEELRVSRTMVIAAREEERQRLRHELHDGLGPSLTGIGLAADAAANLVAAHPERAASVLRELGADARATLLEVRRLVEGLRPEAIDRVGLIGALEQRALQLSRPETDTPLTVRVVAPETLPSLPPLVEVTAFRIATEAMTNAARHSAASLAVVSLEVTDCLVVGVRDDGERREPWKAGVGLEAMQARVRELGGTLIAGPGDRGGVVEARLPLRPP